MSDIAITTKAVLTENEQNLLEALTDPRSVVSLVITGATPATELFGNLELCCKAYLHLEKIQRKIGPVVGQILLVLRDNPDKYQSHGYQTFEDFLSRFIEKKMGYSRSSAYQSMRLVSKFPGLTIDKWRELGTERIQILSKFTQESDPSFPKYLAAASQAKSKIDLMEWAANRQLVQQGESHLHAVIIKMSINLRKAWRVFISEGRVHAYTGSQVEGVIFEAMLAECMSTWLHDDLRVETPTPPVMGIVHGLCSLCKKRWQINIPERISMHDLRGLMHDHHKEESKNCDEGASNLIIDRPAAAVT